jgi:tRNA pseudouridine13 synthase
MLRFEKTGLNTQDAVRQIARALDSDPAQAGWAGLKDRHAVTKQWITLFNADAERALRLDLPGIHVLEAVPHPHKIRTGHLKANRFVIRVRCAATCLDPAQTLLAQLCDTGAPNYYGEQRFGHGRNNLARARRWLLEDGPAPRDRFERKFLASTLQSEWFNQWLAARVRASGLQLAVRGDLMRKEDSGGIFVALDMDDAASRMVSWAISPTGPIFGDEMRWPEADELEIEQNLWQRAGLSAERLRSLRKLLPGSRRSARIRPADASLQTWAAGLELTFTLPKGAYATVILRELLKPEGDDSELVAETDLAPEPSV